MPPYTQLSIEIKSLPCLITDHANSYILHNDRQQTINREGFGTMFSRIRTNAVRMIFRGLRELVLILGVGILGSQLLISLNGGVPLGTRAEASSSLHQAGRVYISSIHYELDPSSPVELKAIDFAAALPNGSAPREVKIALSPNSNTYTCRSVGSGIWTCPTPGIRLLDLERIIATGS